MHLLVGCMNYLYICLYAKIEVLQTAPPGL
jgi:hypothetical protein